MKKLFLLTLLGAILSLNTFAQTKKGDVRVSAGMGAGTLTETAFGIASALTNMWGGINGETITDDNTGTKFGVVVLGFKYNVSDKVSIGTDLAYEAFSSRKLDMAVLSVIPRADLSWINKEKFRLYSGLGAGVAFGIDTKKANGTKVNDETNTSFAFNFVPAGVEFGDKVCFYAETAVGFNGMISGGIRFKL